MDKGKSLVVTAGVASTGVLVVLQFIAFYAVMDTISTLMIGGIGYFVGRYMSK